MAARPHWLGRHATRLHELLRTSFGVAGALRSLPGSVDHNVLVEAGERHLLLKVMHAGCAPELVLMQARLLEHAAARAPEVAVQRLVRALDGRPWVPVGLDGREHLAWVTTFLPGRLLAEVRPQTGSLHRAAGAALARLDLALADFDDPLLDRELSWNLHQAGRMRGHVDAIADGPLRQAVAAALDRFVAEWSPRLDALPRAAIHGDGNDHNVLVDDAGIVGLLDFGDACRAARICEVAILGAYAMLATERPIDGLCAATAGYHGRAALTDEELALLAPLALTRLAVSVVHSALAGRQRPGERYVTVHEQAAAAVLRDSGALEQGLQLAHLRVREACGLDPCPRGAALSRWLAARRGTFAAVLGDALPLRAGAVLDLSFTSLLPGDDPEDFDPAECGRRVTAELSRQGASVGIGRYLEPRPVYQGPLFGDTRPNGRRRTVHLGVDLFAAAGSEVRVPLAGEVVRAEVAAGRLDYGGFVILRHVTDDELPFGTLYGHLDPDSLATLRPGNTVAAGQLLARLGAPPANGDWPPHLHLQLLAEDPARAAEVPPGVAEPDDATALAAAFPDPSPLLDLLPTATFATPDAATLLGARQQRFPANLRTGHGAALHMVRGRGHFLYDRHGRRYVDAYNNVPHVGHGHPRVTAAVQRQFALLATNTRYLSEQLTRYADALCARLPAPLSVCLFTASGSEANELALRLVRAHTGRRDVLVMDHGYHGHTTGCIDVSPYKWRPQGQGPQQPDWVHVTPQPCTYRGPFRGADAGARYAAEIAAHLARLQDAGRQAAAYLSECLPSVGGQLVPPPGFFRDVYRAVRTAGGLCIGDDVQTALGRLGDHFFGFQLHDAAPDILVLGKPLGNGYPLAAVVTTPEIAQSFAAGPEFFSTFGGNTVACAAGLAVLEVLEEEQLQDNARRIGARLAAGLHELQQRHEVIGDVRGSGLFLGVDLVLDRQSRAPATAAARYVRDRLRQRRVLIGTDGPADNVLKIRPPMCFDADAADVLLEELATILDEDGARPPARRRDESTRT